MNKILGQDPVVIVFIVLAIIVFGWLAKKAFSGNFSRY
mgnify:CR=1 FL=1